MGKKITMRIVKHQNCLPKVQSSSLEVFKPTRQKKIEQPGLASFDQEVRWKTSWGPFKLELSYDLLQILSHCVCCVWQRYSSLISTFLLFVLSSIVIFFLCVFIFLNNFYYCSIQMSPVYRSPILYTPTVSEMHRNGEWESSNTEDLIFLVFWYLKYR